ncbi:UDP-2,3-diacylglucosamine diphosphatase [uncultured Oxalicibacterium sp.]|uniref:UDP-2,3-diacylglucosamine diphosphatase n=1 Tax=uncultured Oxalicibacterium sp. TaxID=1168540 RepID=UPI0025DA8B8E|nr:UDP-2,3-diacylglucosamine diphosphatase [uncultured Oxalicibacterium sp.]
MAALFVSDLHLQPDMPHTTQAFFDFLDTHANRAAQLFLLGDIFEAWAGDDDLGDPYNDSVVQKIRAVAERGTQVSWMAGNRDFLAGEKFAEAAQLQLLPDPHVATIGDHRFILTHGDAYCTDDAAYMQFRSQVRSAQWQAGFLGMPLAERKKIIAQLRAGSRAAQQEKSYDIMDVNDAAIRTLFAQCDTDSMIHGHTHRPAVHSHDLGGQTGTRYVLSDWELDGKHQRGDWLAIDWNGKIKRFDFNGREVT